MRIPKKSVGWIREAPRTDCSTCLYIKKIRKFFGEFDYKCTRNDWITRLYAICNFWEEKQ